MNNKAKKVENEEEEIFQNILRVVKDCPCCKKNYIQDGFSLIEDSTDFLVFYVDCRNCNQNMIVSMHIGNFGSGVVGIVTDLTRNDLDRLYFKRPISVDETFGFRELLRNDSKKIVEAIVG